MARTLSSARGGRVAAIALTLAAVAVEAGAQTPRTFAELSLDELARLEVTSVSRRAESVADAPASIFVITAEDIRRSGATRLAEALRLAPNLQVAQVDASQYAISARGFNGLAANKLLVLVDGRVIYTALFSGVFWDQQDVPLEDVERIEVISGPGATLWGANAVNGVINVITRPVRDTQGSVVSARGGNLESGALYRYGGAFGDGGRIRAYGKVTHLENTRRADRAAVRDGRDWLQAGFRAEWGGVGDEVTVQGDAHRVRSEDRGSVGTARLGRAELTGMNLLARWTRSLGDGGEVTAQGYFDHMRRDESILFQPEANVFDVGLQHSVARASHSVVWGAGYRHGTDEVRDGFLVGFRPTSRDLSWVNVYAQDEIRLHERLKVSGGLRVSRNGYTGWEYQPDARIAWKPSSQQLVWGGVSRAVRTPARFDRDVIRPLGGVLGGPDFVSEVATVLQLGYRAQAAGALTWSVTAFRHDWDRLRSATAPPVIIENKIEGPVYGVEGWASWQALPRWRLSGGATTFRKDLRLQPDSTDLVGVSNPQLSNDPEQQALLRSSLDLWRDHEIDATLRYVGELPTPIVPAYVAFNVRYAWHAREDLELSVVARNLFDRSHPEFNALPGRSEFERGVFVQARWAK